MTSRETIISEIQRLAKDIGRTPGKKVFTKLTAIPENHWYGKYWLSWHDAVNEAGLEANNIPSKIEAYTLLEQLAEITIQNQQFPTVAKLRMLRRADPNVPSHTTLNKKFGSMKKAKAHLFDWAQNSTKHRDLLNYMHDPNEQVFDPETNEEYSDGVVYLLQSGNNFKIGRGQNLERRIKEIRIQMPDDVNLVHFIKTDDPSGIEAYWHRRFSDKRKNGEWFQLTSSDVRAFRKRKYQ